MAVNFVMFKDGSRHDFPVPDGVTTVGRREDCGLRVPVADVSRTHCQVSVSGDKVTIKDLGSANGTYVNDQRVNEHSLRPGDLVKVGPCIFTVQINGKPAQIVSPEELAALMEEDASGEIPPPPGGANAPTTMRAPAKPPQPVAPPRPAAAPAAAKPAASAPAAAGTDADDQAMEFLEELDMTDLDEAGSESDLGADFSALDDLDLDLDDGKK